MGKAFGHRRSPRADLRQGPLDGRRRSMISRQDRPRVLIIQCAMTPASRARPDDRCLADRVDPPAFSSRPGGSTPITVTVPRRDLTRLTLPMHPIRQQRQRRSLCRQAISAVTRFHGRSGAASRACWTCHFRLPGRCTRCAAACAFALRSPSALFVSARSMTLRAWAVSTSSSGTTFLTPCSTELLLDRTG